MNDTSPWYGRRVALRAVGRKWALMYRKIAKKQSMPFTEDCYWNFHWERGVVIDERDGIALVVLDDWDISRPVRVKVSRLTCFKCCGMGELMDFDMESNPVRSFKIKCPECVNFPRAVPRFRHMRDEWGEGPDSDPTGEWENRYRVRVEKLNKEIAEKNATKQQEIPFRRL